jgi:23S rRNA (guanosine2251-2'-O)-methyltransferase
VAPIRRPLAGVAQRQPPAGGVEPLLVYGRQPVLEALRSKARVLSVRIAAEVQRSAMLDAIAAAAEQRRVRVLPTSVDELDDRCAGGHHQGVCASVYLAPSPSLDDLLPTLTVEGRSPPLLVAVDQLEDPQNLGALIRSAEAAGADAIVLPERRTAGITAAVVRASAGAAFHLPAITVGNLTRAIELLKRHDIWVAGLSEDARTPYTKASLNVPLCIVVGAEGRGLSRLVIEHCDMLLRLPMAGHIASLNAATAAAIVLFEVVRQREGSNGTP